jgi:hypothetical protein
MAKFKKNEKLFSCSKQISNRGLFYYENKFKNKFCDNAPYYNLQGRYFYIAFMLNVDLERLPFFKTLVVNIMVICYF